MIIKIYRDSWINKTIIYRSLKQKEFNYYKILVPQISIRKQKKKKKKVLWKHNKKKGAQGILRLEDLRLGRPLRNWHLSRTSYLSPHQRSWGYSPNPSDSGLVIDDGLNVGIGNYNQLLQDRNIVNLPQGKCSLHLHLVQGRDTLQRNRLENSVTSQASGKRCNHPGLGNRQLILFQHPTP